MRLAVTRYEGPETGGGPTLVVAHGLFGAARNWATLAKRFAETRPVVAVDLRNHGESDWAAEMDYPSMAADLLETIDAEAGGSAALLGHSMGGKAAMVAALTAPEKIRALVVADIAPVAYAHSHAPFLNAMRRVDLSHVSRRSEVDPMLAEAIPEPALRAFILQNLTIDGGAARWRINIDAIDQAMATLTGWPSTFDPTALTARRYDGPTLFHHGGASDYVDTNAHGRIRLLFPEAAVETMVGAGHWLHAERPQEFFATVDGWLARVAPKL